MTLLGVSYMLMMYSGACSLTASLVLPAGRFGRVFGVVLVVVAALALGASAATGIMYFMERGVA